MTCLILEPAKGSKTAWTVARRMKVARVSQGMYQKSDLRLPQNNRIAGFTVLFTGKQVLATSGNVYGLLLCILRWMSFCVFVCFGIELGGLTHCLKRGGFIWKYHVVWNLDWPGFKFVVTWPWAVFGSRFLSVRSSKWCQTLEILSDKVRYIICQRGWSSVRSQ